MFFEPEANQELIIGQTIYRLAEHPAAPGSGVIYLQTGRAGTVYQLIDTAGRFYALKVFNQQFREPWMAGLSERLKPFASLPGLTICDRQTLTPQRHRATLDQYPELLYAALMPWVEGQTWSDRLQDKTPLLPERSLALAHAFLDVLVHLEQNGIAHGDLSGPNLLFDDTGGLMRVELVDVEQLFGPGLARPGDVFAGAPGYAHAQAANGLWQANMDRFAGAVMLAEMLGWCDDQVIAAAAGDAYFSAEVRTPDDEGRYKVLHAALAGRWGERAANLLDRAWQSQVLADCPSFGEWKLALAPSPAIATTRNSHPHSASSDEPAPPKRSGEPQDDRAGNTRAGIAALLSEGVAEERAGQLEEALGTYRMALAILPPGDPLEPEIELVIDRVTKKIAALARPVVHSPGQTNSSARRWIVPVALVAVTLLAGLLYAGTTRWGWFNSGDETTSALETATSEAGVVAEPTPTGQLGSDRPATPAIQKNQQDSLVSQVRTKLVSLVAQPVYAAPPDEIERAQDAALLPALIDPVGDCGADLPLPGYSANSVVNFRWQWPLEPANSNYLEVRVGPAGARDLRSLGKVEPALARLPQGDWQYSVRADTFAVDGVAVYEWQVYYMAPDGRVLLNSLPSCIELRSTPQKSTVEQGMDQDGDGVPDDQDLCPDIRAGNRPDSRRLGCPLGARSGDLDGDAIEDAEDQCLKEPAGRFPDLVKKGCPLDSDNDTVSDEFDFCYTMPQGDKPDADRPGCPLDHDGDGVPNSRDACWLIVAGANPDPDWAGCPFVDTDLDSVSDLSDQCPALPVGDNPDPDARGCPTNREVIMAIVDGGPGDYCPDVAEGNNPDPNMPGCPMVDSDEDGYPDHSDWCVAVPAGDRPDPQWPGCPLGDDDDGDGVPNDQDLCSTIPMGANPDFAWPGCPFEDADDDGLSDYSDYCPGTPVGAAPDPLWPGCPLVMVALNDDDDGDGVVNGDDFCIDIPQGDNPDTDWPGCPFADSDGDRISDLSDACLETPAGDLPDPGQSGCPLLDGDGDGVADSDDACRTTPAGDLPDFTNLGCPRESDGDGVPDNLDFCVDDPAGSIPDPGRPGCPRDTDSDDVPDAGDGCRYEQAGDTPDPRNPGCPAIVDADGDGVTNDGADLCPAEPAGSDPDPDRPGCPQPTDPDGDDVPNDGTDWCPDLPAGDRPDPGQPGCPQEDLDGDGVFDNDDDCPSQDAGPDPDPDHLGCPMPDSDGDGFNDGIDSCQFVPAGAEPDPNNRGCPLDSDSDGVPDETDECDDRSLGPMPDLEHVGCPQPDTPEPPTDTPTPEPPTDTPTPEPPTDTPTPEPPTDTPTPEPPTDTPTPEPPTDTPTPEPPTDTPTPEPPTDTPTPEPQTDTPTSESVTDTPTPEKVTPEPTPELTDLRWWHGVLLGSAIPT